MFSCRAHGSLLGIGAIKRLSPDHAEIKCGPFGGYQPSADNFFMTLALGS